MRAKLSLEEFKSVSLEILKGVHNYCKKNDIRYTLAAGTLIGAIRHKGFIPWDDDIDIYMPRPDYEKFLKSFNDEYENLKVVAPEIDANYYVPYANVYDTRTLLVEDNISHRGIEIGVKIDIFPVDGVSDDIDDYNMQKKRIDWINRIMSAKRYGLGYYFPRSILMTIGVMLTRVLYCLVPYKNLQNKLRKEAIQYDFDHSKYVAHLVYSSGFDTRHKKSVYDSFIEVPFENYNFMIASGYDEILTTIYGDYMQLPPIEKRVTHHRFNAWWK